MTDHDDDDDNRSRVLVAVSLKSPNHTVTTLRTCNENLGPPRKVRKAKRMMIINEPSLRATWVGLLNDNLYKLTCKTQAN